MARMMPETALSRALMIARATAWGVIVCNHLRATVRRHVCAWDRVGVFVALQATSNGGDEKPAGALITREFEKFGFGHGLQYFTE